MYQADTAIIGSKSAQISLADDGSLTIDKGYDGRVQLTEREVNQVREWLNCHGYSIGAYNPCVLFMKDQSPNYGHGSTGWEKGGHTTASCMRPARHPLQCMILTGEPLR